MKKIVFLLLFMLVFSGFSVFSDDSNPENFQAKYYENAKVIRLKYIQGETFLFRSYDEGKEEATINSPVFEKDRAGTTLGRIEAYLGRLNYLRLDNDSEVEFLKVPPLRKTNMELRVLRGSIYLEITNLDFEKDIEIQTDDCGVFILDKGLYRIDVNETGGTEVYVFDGLAEVAGENFSRNVRENQKVVMLSGNVKERPFYFYATNTDGFDDWNKQRMGSNGYAKYGSSRYLDEGYEDYEYELTRSGRWRYDSTYGSNVWIPYNIGNDWRPYYNGRWIWNPFYGYVWNSYDSWGWYTHHYGRWHYSPFYGWYWIPGYHWSPAWVHWSWGYNHYGWCPLNYYNRPLIVINKRWLRRYNLKKGFPVRAMSTVVVRKNKISASNIRRVALKGNTGIKNDLKFRGAGPTVKPNHSYVKVRNANGRQSIYKRDGLVSSSRYKDVKPVKPGSVKQRQDSNSSRYISDRSVKRRKFESTGYRSSGSYQKTYRSETRSSSGTQAKRYSGKSTSTRSVKKSSSSQSKTRKSSSKSSSSKTRKKKDEPSYGFSNPSYSPRSESYKGGSSKSYRSSGKRYTSKSSTVSTRSRSSQYSSQRSQKPAASSSYSSRQSSSRSGYTPATRPRYNSSSSNNRSNSSYRTPSRSYRSSGSTYRAPSRSSSSSSRSSYRAPSRSSSSSSRSSYRAPSRSSSSSSRSSYRAPSRSSSSSSRSSTSRSSSSSSRSSKKRK